MITHVSNPDYITKNRSKTCKNCTHKKDTEGNKCCCFEELDDGK